MAAAPSFPTLSLPPIHLQPSPIFAPPHRLTVFSEFYNSSPHLSPHCWPDAESDGASSPQSLRYPVMWFHCIFGQARIWKRSPCSGRGHRGHIPCGFAQDRPVALSAQISSGPWSARLWPPSASLYLLNYLYTHLDKLTSTVQEKKKFVFLNNIF